MSEKTEQMTMEIHVRESNLIEGFNDRSMDDCGLAAWALLQQVDGYLREEDLFRVHRVVVARQGDPRWVGRAEWRGCWRQLDVEVRGYPCPPHQEVPELMREWLADMRDWEDCDPQEMHVRFEKIHPFADGNGRVGRLLMWLHELSLEQRPTLVKVDDMWDYFAWFEDDDED